MIIKCLDDYDIDIDIFKNLEIVKKLIPRKILPLTKVIESFLTKM